MASCTFENFTSNIYEAISNSKNCVNAPIVKYSLTVDILDNKPFTSDETVCSQRGIKMKIHSIPH